MMEKDYQNTRGRHNTNVISKITNDYLNDNNDITFNNNRVIKML